MLTVALVTPRRFGEVDRARLAVRRDQVGDQLDVVLGQLGLVRLAHLLEAARLAPGLAQRRPLSHLALPITP